MTRVTIEVNFRFRDISWLLPALQPWYIAFPINAFRYAVSLPITMFTSRSELTHQGP